MDGKKREEERRRRGDDREEAVAEVKRVKLGPSKLWTGLVLHHKDVFVSHVLSKLNLMDQFFFSKVNRESRGVLEYAGVDVSELRVNVFECSSTSTLESWWNDFPWGKKVKSGKVIKPGFASKLLLRTNSSFSSGREK